MTTERTSHRIAETGDIYCGDGYDFLEWAETAKWHPVSAWGADGWDLGSWPLVSFSWRQRPDGRWDVVEHVEGDLTFLEGATIEERDAWLDMKACWFWQSGQSDGPVQTYVDADGNPTPGNQNWNNRVNLVQRALADHLSSLGLEPAANEWEWWDQLRQHRGVADDPSMLDGWFLPEWRGPYSSKRSTA